MRYFALLLIVAATSAALGSSVHEYKPHEYLPIVRGVSPDGRHAIVAHGSSDHYGYDGFQLYLMDAKTHKPLVGLKEPKGLVVDTGPDAYYADWSADSKQVSVTFRAERHLAVRVRYRVTDGHVSLIEGRTPVSGLPRN
jgi:hypothetical protein